MSSPYIQDDTLANNPLLNGSYEITDSASGVAVTSITAAGFLGIMGSLVQLGTTGAGTMSIQNFTFGQVAVPGNPRNFLRLAWTTAATALTPQFTHKIEDVRTFSGQKVTLQGWYRANAAMGFRLRQDFGSGGSPTADVNTSPNGPINSLPSTVDADGTAQWRPFALTFNLPSIVGLTLGTTANTSYLGVDFLPPYAIAQYDFARLRLVPAGERSPMIQHRSFAEEEKLLARYYQHITNVHVFSGGTSMPLPYGPMRAAPVVSGTAGSPFSGSSVSTIVGTNSGSSALMTGVTLDARIAD